MAEVTKTNPQPPATIAIPPCNKLAEKMIAGEALGLLDACYVKSDGLVWKATGAAANAAAAYDGVAFRAAAVGEPVTLVWGVVAQYGTGLTPGASYFLSGTVAGGLADAASTGGTRRIAFAVDTTRVQFLPIN